MPADALASISGAKLVCQTSNSLICLKECRFNTYYSCFREDNTHSDFENAAESHPRATGASVSSSGWLALNPVDLFRATNLDKQLELHVPPSTTLMSCLAGIGGRVKSLMNKAERAESILVIDGCPLNCARHTLELAGLKSFRHLELHRLGFRKASCPPTPERVTVATKAAARMIAAEQVTCHDHTARETVGVA